jgi:hypothetical protein
VIAVNIIEIASDPNNDPTPETSQCFEIVTKDQNLLGSRFARHADPHRGNRFLHVNSGMRFFWVGSYLEAFSHRTNLSQLRRAVSPPSSVLISKWCIVSEGLR